MPQLLANLFKKMILRQLATPLLYGAELYRGLHTILSVKNITFALKFAFLEPFTEIIIVKTGSRLYIRLILVWLLVCVTMPAEAGSFTVVIDAGHGGKDPGARGVRINEKTINLAVALKLGSFIEQRSEGVKVIYTRKTDRFIELDERADIANRNKADLFISIHTNAVKRGSAVQGTETYTLGLARTDENLEVAMSENSAILLEDNYQQRYEGFDPNSSESYIIFEFMQNKHMEQSISLASEIQKSFKGAKRVDRGVRQAGFLVLRKTSMSSVLVELGYISNRQEENYLSSVDGQNALAEAIYEAFSRYKRSYDRRAGGVVTTSVPTKAAMTQEAGLISASEDEFTVRPEKIQEGSGAPAGSEADIQYRKQHQTETSVKEKSVSKPTEKKSTKSNTTQKVAVGKTVYKVQILTANKQLPANSSRFKGYKPVNYYVEKGIYKYTYGETTDFAEIKRIRRRLLKDFKDAFIVGFKDGKKVKY